MHERCGLNELWGYRVGEALEVYMAVSDQWVVANVVGVERIPDFGLCLVVRTVNRSAMQSSFRVGQPKMVRKIPRDMGGVLTWLDS